MKAPRKGSRAYIKDEGGKMKDDNNWSLSHVLFKDA
jgi:hypothetical protein